MLCFRFFSHHTLWYVKHLEASRDRRARGTPKSGRRGTMDSDSVSQLHILGPRWHTLPESVFPKCRFKVPLCAGFVFVVYIAPPRPAKNDALWEHVLLHVDGGVGEIVQPVEDDVTQKSRRGAGSQVHIRAGDVRQTRRSGGVDVFRGVYLAPRQASTSRKTIFERQQRLFGHPCVDTPRSAQGGRAEKKKENSQ